MSFDLELYVTTANRGPQPALRVCLDTNVWVSYLAASSLLKRGVPADLVDLIDAGNAHGLPLQLFLSWELIDTIRTVLLRLSVKETVVAPFIDAIVALMRTGPGRLEPPLFLAGREQLAMHDREDAGVLASCFAHDVELLVTDNLDDFAMADAERIDTQVIVRRDGSKRQLFTLIHEPVQRACLVVMHPIDALEWLGNGERPTPENVRAVYGSGHE